MGGSIIPKSIHGLAIRVVRGFERILRMTEKPRIWANRIAKLVVGMSICFLAYDLLMPIYHDVEFSDFERTDKGIQAKIKFVKDRDCAPITGTVVAFVYFGEDYRLPATILKDGEVLVLKNFPPSQTPTSVTLTWVAASDLPDPTGISMGFYLKCQTRIAQHIEWFSDIHLGSPAGI